MSADLMAWEQPEARTLWLAHRRKGRVWRLLGYCGLIAFFVVVGMQSAQTDRIVGDGVEATGQVLEDPATTLRCGQVPVPIEFEVEGERRVYNFFVSGCGGGGLSKGDRVDVVYNAENPQEFLVDQTPSDPPIPTLIGVIGLVAGIFALVGTVNRGWQSRRLRKLLRTHPWRSATAEVCPFQSGWVKGWTAIRLHAEDRPSVLLASRHLANDDGVLRYAGSSGGPVAVDDGDGMGLARPPRTELALRRATEQLGES